MPATVKVVLMTREYPPHVYGGAGVHVEYMARELSRMPDLEVEVRRFLERGDVPPPTVTVPPPDAGRMVTTGQPPVVGPVVRAFGPWQELTGPHSAALRVLSVDLAMAATLDGDLVHSHTWYANLAGHIAKLAHGLPHVVTSHSLEPMRPWKAEQLGPGGYALSSFCERTALEAADAVVAVSNAMREDLLKAYPVVDPERVEVIHNGIDPDEYRPDPATDVLERYGVDPAMPTVVFVGRVTRQKGIAHLLDAVPAIDGRAQVVCLAGAPDTEEVGREVAAKLAGVGSGQARLVWIERMLPKREVIQVLSHATVFVCPSVYEPLGIVNLEAMACGAAVVASAVGGIPEVVEEGVTGFLVPFEPAGPAGAPADPRRFARDLADRINALVGDPSTADRFGRAGRQRILDRFTWKAAAARTSNLYGAVLAR